MLLEEKSYTNEIRSFRMHRTIFALRFIAYFIYLYLVMYFAFNILQMQLDHKYLAKLTIRVYLLT